MFNHQLLNSNLICNTISNGSIPHIENLGNKNPFQTRKCRIYPTQDKSHPMTDRCSCHNKG